MTTNSDKSARDHHPQRRARHRRVIKPQHPSLGRLMRANAKHLVESGQVDVLPLCGEDRGRIDKARLRGHIQRHLRTHLNSASKTAHKDHAPRKMDCPDDGRDLAYSDIQLPSDGHRLARRPALGREDAFHYESPSKGRIHVRRRPEPGNDDQQVAHLYRMGLLYDGEQDPGGEIVDLNSIKHDEPLYSVRPATRERKSGRTGRALDRHLHLDLSLSDLGEDEALAQYLLSLNGPEAGDKTSTSTGTTKQTSRESADSQPPLRVIYELSGPQPHFHVDASQPPDLITDGLSDYDYFSDGEVDDDTPSQREVREDADSAPSDAWVMLGDGV